MAIKNPLTKDDDTEFKKLAAVYAYDVINSTPGALEAQQQRIFNMVHGQANCPSILLAICEGTGQFDRLYEQTTIANVNVSGNGCTTKIFLKPLFSPNRNAVLLAAGDHIQVKWLRMKSLNGDCTELVSARTLSTHARGAIREGKKALAIATKFLPADRKLPSGITSIDLMNHVLEEMWKQDYAVKNKIDPTVATSVPIPRRPEQWVFNGYLAYAFFGCPVLVPDDKRLGVFTVGGKVVDNRTNTGRRYVKPILRRSILGNKKKSDFKEDANSSILRQQQITSLQSENQHESQTLHAAKVLVHDQLLSNLKFQKHAMEMVQFYRTLGDIDATKEAIEELKEYGREKKSLKLKALQLETRDPKEVKASTKRKEILQVLLTEPFYSSQDDQDDVAGDLRRTKVAKNNGVVFDNSRSDGVIMVDDESDSSSDSSSDHRCSLTYSPHWTDS